MFVTSRGATHSDIFSCGEQLCCEPFHERLQRVQRSIFGHWRPDGLQFMKISPPFVQAVHEPLRLLLDVGCLGHSVDLDTFVNYHAVHSSLAPCECTGGKAASSADLASRLPDHHAIQRNSSTLDASCMFCGSAVLRGTKELNRPFCVSNSGLHGVW